MLFIFKPFAPIGSFIGFILYINEPKFGICAVLGDTYYLYFVCEGWDLNPRTPSGLATEANAIYGVSFIRINVVLHIDILCST